MGGRQIPGVVIIRYKLFYNMNILFIAAHPDDIEILCAGTLIRYAQEGHQVTMAVFTTGNMGDTTIQPGELAVIRETHLR